jgi:hypothetical protein
VLDTTTWRPSGVTSILNGLNATGMSSALSYVMLVPSIDSTPTLFIRGMQTKARLPSGVMTDYALAKTAFSHLVGGFNQGAGGWQGAVEQCPSAAE